MNYDVFRTRLINELSRIFGVEVEPIKGEDVNEYRTRLIELLENGTITGTPGDKGSKGEKGDPGFGTEEQYKAITARLKALEAKL